MNATLKEEHPKVANRSASHTIRVPVIPTWYYVMMVAALMAGGCTSGGRSCVTGSWRRGNWHLLGSSTRATPRPTGRGAFLPQE
jgi:hypothetical protein